MSPLPALDSLLYRSDGWYALDASNVHVKGVHPSTLDAALSLVGRGRVATIYGRLIPAARVVDIDVSGDDGLAIVDMLDAWAAREDVWVLSRPSGGGDGRHHVYVLTRDQHGDHLPSLREEVTRLRQWFSVPAKAIDVRDAVRPLCAPHRTGITTAPYGDVTAALEELRHRLVATTPHPAATRESRDERRTPLTPRPRPRRNLPPEWAAYLATGETPALGGRDHSRSAVEAVCISHMIRAGWTWHDAHRAIYTSHPSAMTRAKTGGLHRLTGIWNKAVLADAEHTAEHGIPSRDPLTDDLAHALHAARERLTALAWTLSPRQRPAVLHAADALLARMECTRTLRVPCAERDLAEDTGLDRSTIRAALRTLHGAVGTLHKTDLTPTQGSTTSAYEFEIAPAGEGVRQIPPPSSHTPSRPPYGTWRLLPRRAHQLHRVLHPTTGQTLDTLAVTAQATDTPTTPLTPSQTRTLTTTLRALARVGLARCDEHGRWTSTHTPTAEHAARAAAAYSHQVEQHTAERAAYRAHAGTHWHHQQRAALARNHARQQAWWRALTPAERARRRDQHRATYRALPIGEQAAVKDTLAARRRRAGINEAERHADWLAAWHPDALAQRQAQHLNAHYARPRELRAAYAAMWHDHRTRWHIPYPAREATPAVSRP